MLLSHELYADILSKRHSEEPNVFTLDGTEYTQVSGYAPTYSGSWIWEEYTEMLVKDKEGNLLHLTLWTDKYDIGYPIEYNYTLRYTNCKVL